jgi:hypothetical protein
MTGAGPKTAIFRKFKEMAELFASMLGPAARFLACHAQGVIDTDMAENS